MPTKSLSIIVPAFNEEGNIRDTCADAAALAEKYLTDYEILVFDDASQDQTDEKVRALQKENPHIFLFQNLVNKGLGYNYREGVLKARCQYTMLIPGDNEVTGESLADIFKQIGTADILLCYIANSGVRPVWRQRISKAFTVTLNLLFGLTVPYYNGPSVIRTDLAKQFVPLTSGFAYMAVMLVQMLKSGASCKEVSFSLRGRQYGRTKAFRLKNIISVLKNIFILYCKVAILHQLRQIPKPVPQPNLEHTRIGS